MLGAFLLGLAPILLIGIAAACVRRGLPLAAACATGWLVHASTQDAASAMCVAVAGLGLSAYAFDRLAAWAPTRAITIALEFAAGLALAIAFACAVSYSAGLRDGSLAVVIAATFVLALGTLARFRFESMTQ